jgi:hypothetical protein
MECFFVAGSLVAVVFLGFVTGTILQVSKNEKAKRNYENYIWHIIIQRIEDVNLRFDDVERTLNKNKRGVCECYKEVPEWDRITDPAIKWDPKIEGKRSGDTWPEGP